MMDKILYLLGAIATIISILKAIKENETDLLIIAIVFLFVLSISFKTAINIMKSKNISTIIIKKGALIRFLSLSLLLGSIILFLMLPLISIEKIITSLPPVFVCSNGALASGKEPCTNFYREKDLPPGTVGNKIRFEIKAGLWSVLPNDIGSIDIKILGKNRFELNETITIDNQIPNKSYTNKQNESLMKKYIREITWDYVVKPTKIEFSANPGTYALSISSLKIFTKYKINFFQWSTDFFL